MIIGIDASRANEKKKTGTEWYAYHLIEEFKKIADPDDQFVLYSKDPLNDDLAKLPTNFSSKVLGWPPKFLWTHLRLSLEMIFNKPDVLFVPAHTIPIFHPKNTVTTLHDVGFERFHKLYSKKPIGYKKSFTKWLINFAVKIVTFGKYGSNEYDYHRFSARFALKHAKTILTISKFSKKEILDLFGFQYEKKISVIPLAYDKSVLNISFDEDRVKKVLDKYMIREPFILYTGRLEEKKNILGLIESFNILKTKYNFDGQLVLLGKRGYNYDLISNRINKYNLNSRVIEPGWVTEEERVLLLKFSRAFVFPSFYEGFGIPPLEAMALGVPVIASNQASIPEVTGDAAILVDPNNYQNMAEEINNVITNTNNTRNILIEKGYDHIKRFSWESTAKTTLEKVKHTVNS